MPINYEAAKTLIKGLVQKMKSFRGNWNQNDPTADDYIKNRPFYAEVKESEVYAVPRQGYAFDVGDYVAGYHETNSNDIFTVGKTYMVEIDGAVSELKCKSMTIDNGPTWKYFGSMCLIIMMEGLDRATAAAYLLENFGIEDSGENFCILSAPAQGMFFIVFEDISTTIHSVAVYSIEDVECVHKINSKYLPDMNYVSFDRYQSLTREQQYNVLDNIGDVLWDNFADRYHSHTTSDIYSGIFPVTRGGTGYSSIADATYTTARYRASSLHSTETNPTTNGTICWTYE